MISQSALQIYAQYEQLKNEVQELGTNGFNELALKIFRFQYQFNPIYKDFVSNLRIDVKKITQWQEIPCMPISFFKHHDVIIEQMKTDRYFLSSGTTGMRRSKRLVADLPFYESISIKSFEFNYGPINQYRFFAVLPNYLENPHSSLIHMVDHFIELAGDDFGGYYNISDTDKVQKDIKRCKEAAFKPILIGVSFALLDLTEQEDLTLRKIIVMETGGMKGRRKELTREELHAELTNSFGVTNIHSEYGMSELYSQMYSTKNGVFFSPPWSRVKVMEINDPLSSEKNGKTGRLNIIDLANLDACCFIATEDLGRMNEDGSFIVTGRHDNADIRGCNLMTLNE